MLKLVFTRPLEVLYSILNVIEKEADLKSLEHTSSPSVSDGKPRQNNKIRHLL